MKRSYALNNNSFAVFIKLFDSQIQPIVQYGSELWGLDKAAVHFESVHTFALKKFLGVDRKTPNDLLYGETNRFPIYVNSAVKCVCFWLKLVQMEDQRIPRKAYNMLYSLDDRGKENWVSKVRVCLFEYGYGFVWMNQGVGNVNDFIKAFRQRLIDCTWQKWSDHIQTSERFEMYRNYSSTASLRSYLVLDMGQHLKYITTRFRLGISDLMVHRFRYKTINSNNLICPLCKQTEENEIHFVLCCQGLTHIREIFIRPEYYRQPSLFKLSLLMSSSTAQDVRNFSLYLYKAFKFTETATA